MSLRVTVGNEANGVLTKRGVIPEGDSVGERRLDDLHLEWIDPSRQCHLGRTISK